VPVHIGAVELRNSIAASSGIDLPSTLVFDYPTVAAILEFMTPLMPSNADDSDSADADADDAVGASEMSMGRMRFAQTKPSRGDSLIGIVGTSSQTARNALHAGAPVDGLTVVPLARWSIDKARYDDSLIQARFGSFVSDVDQFDCDLFNVSSKEGVLMDPQHRMLLEAAWEAKSGGAVAGVSPERQGVTVGIASNEYGRLVDAVSVYTATGSAQSVACGRMSYTFGLQGICLSIDTACSSSLVGLHIAINSILSGESAAVSACASHICVDALTTEMFSKAGMLAKDGRCKTLDAGADGYVRGEACVVLELRTLSGDEGIALHSGSMVASAVNQDGRSSSLTAPNGPSQQRAIRSALRAARMYPTALDGLEMHGTGTGLGDPIEVGAAHAVLVEPSRLVPLTLSAMKSCMGHTEPASGAVGILHAVLGVGAHSARPIVHLIAVNPHLASLTRKALSGAVDSMALPRQHIAAVAAPAERPMLRGVSAFAFQGTNAHVMVAAPASVGTAAVAHRGRAAVWNRERLWLSAPHHPLIQSAVAAPKAATVRFEACLSVDHQMYLWDHRVAGRGLLPAAAFLEVGSAALCHIANSNVSDISLAPTAMCGVAITSPLVLPAVKAVVAIACSLNLRSGALEIAAAGAKRPCLTSQCRAIHVRQDADAQVEAQMPTIHGPDGLSRASSTLGRIAHNTSMITGENTGLQMPPAVLDANLQLAGARQRMTALHIPAGIEAYWAPHSAGHFDVWATATSRQAHVSDHTIFAEGGCMIHLAGLEVKATKPGAATRVAMPEAAAAPKAAALKAVSRSVSLVGSPAPPAAPSGFLYEVAWAASAESPGVTQPSRNCFAAATSPQHPHRQASTGIQAAQYAAVSRIPRVTLQTSGAVGGATVRTSGSEIWSVMKCAAPELQSSTAFDGCDGDLNGVGFTVPAQAEIYGTQGITIRGGSIATPAMLPSSVLAQTAMDVTSLTDALASIIRGGDKAVAATHLRHALEVGAPFSSDGATVVTGGLGGLGQLIASHNVRNGSTHLTLLGRSGRAGGMDSLLVSSGACVVMSRSDVSSADEASATAFHSHAPVRVLLHAGGLLKDATIPNQTAGRANTVMAPKCVGMSRLAMETHARAMRSSVMFSSIASLLGSGGQSNYVAANGWLDAFARVGGSQGRTATSVQWGAWGGGDGMAANDAGTIQRMERLGVGILSPSQGLSALEALTRSAACSVACANPFIWDRLLAGMSPVPPFFGKFAHLAPVAPVAASPRAKASPGARVLASSTRALAASSVEAKVMGSVRAILGADVGINEPLIDAGLDSLGAVELRDAVNAAVDMELPSTVVFDYPSVSAMTSYIVSQMHPEEEADESSLIVHPAATRSAQRELLGVVGSSSHTPRGALNAGVAVDAPTRVPLERWCLDGSDDSQAQARFGSFVADADMFDSDLFNVSHNEGVLMDPQQRMLLEAAWEAKAGLQETVPERSGVTVGISGNEYARLSDVVSAYTATGGALSVACGRMSYTFGMQGICLSVDTACSSSLVGSHIAINSILSSESDSVTACGVNVTLNPLSTEMFNKAGMLAKDGRCKTLDSRADGYVRGEACVVLEIRTLSGDADIALHSGSLVASAVNQDGRSSSLTAPNGPSQQRAIRGALRAASMDPTALDGLEMHGTGTGLGDPIEVGAAHAVLVEPSRLVPLTLSAVKSCMGHTEPAAGAVGMLHAVLGVRAHSARPIMQLIAINPHLASLTRKALSGAVDSMALPRQHMAAIAAPSERPMQRGVSGFAFQGTNAHVMVAAPASVGTAAVAHRGRAAVWTRERLWLSAPRHPLLQAASVGPDAAMVRLETCLSVDHQMYLWDHRVAGRGLLPAAAFLEVGSAALRHISDAPSAMCGVAITSPLVLPSVGAGAVVVCSINPGSGALEIASSGAGRPHLTAQCRVIDVPGKGQPTLSVRAVIVHTLEPAPISTVTGRIAHDASVVDGENAGLQMPPAVLDANLQLASAGQRMTSLHIPAGVEAYWAPRKAGQSDVWATATSRAAGFSDHTIFAEGGCMSHLGGLEVKAAGSARASPVASAAPDSKIAASVMYEVAWVASAESPGVTQPSRDRFAAATQSPQHPHRQAATGIQAAQYAAVSRIPRVALQTSGAVGGATVRTSGSEIWGVMRCAAPELQSSTAFDGCDGEVTSASFTVPAQARAHGAQGITIRGGSIASPAMLPSAVLALAAMDVTSLNDALASIMRGGDDASHLRYALEVGSAPDASSSDGATVITGGLGGLGQLIASHNVSNGSTHITLLGRSGRAGEIDSLLVSSGACVVMSRSDVSSADVASSTAFHSHAPVRVLLHAGGLLKDATIANQTAGRANAVMAPKCVGMSRLAMETHARAMRSSVMFSSVASLLGGPGQANYVAANGWLDALARVGASQGRTATSVQWGAWGGGGGMAANDADTIQRMERLGVGILSPSQGLGALEALTRSAACSVACANPFIWDRFLRGMSPVPPFFGEFAHLTPVALVAASSKAKASPGARALSASSVEAKVMGSVRAILGADVGVNEPLIDAGLDSLGAVELRDAVNAAVDMELPSTVVFDYPSVSAMSGFIVSQMHPEEETDEGSLIVHPAATRSAHREMLGVVGSSSHTPCGALNAGGALDGITRVPLERWWLDASDDLHARFGSFVANADMFDSELFNVSATEGMLVDPQQRMLLEAAWEAKVGLQEIVAERSGVTVGISGNEYARMSDSVSAYTATGGALSVACGRMSYTFGMQGICLSVDTACSSSLVGSHIAINSILSGESDSVTACGVNVTLNAVTTEMFSKAGMLAKDGRCKTLDSRADGYVRGEACVVLEIRTLSGHAGIAFHSGSLVASAVNQDGRSSSLTAPNGPSQQRAIRSALRAASMDPGSLDGLEMHGTGTGLGDPIEVGAAHAVLVEPSRLVPLTLSAMKSCMGHTEPAAGAVGMLHAVLGVGAHSAKPIMHLIAVNPHLAGLTRKALSGAVDSMALPRQHIAAVTAPAERPMQRGVSSFAFQGTNAHVMVAAPASISTAAVAHRGRAAVWNRERVWVKPMPGVLIDGALCSFPAGGRTLAAIDIAPGSPIAAYLHNTISVLALASAAASSALVSSVDGVALQALVFSGFAVASDAGIRVEADLASATLVTRDVSSGAALVSGGLGGVSSGVSLSVPSGGASSSAVAAAAAVYPRAVAAAAAGAGAVGMHVSLGFATAACSAAFLGVSYSGPSAELIPVQLRALAAHWSSFDASTKFADAEEMIPTRSAGTSDAGRAVNALTGAVLQRYAGVVQSTGQQYIAPAVAAPKVASATESAAVAAAAAATAAAAAALAAQLPLYTTTWEASGVSPPPPPPPPQRRGDGRTAHRSAAVGARSRPSGASRIVGAHTSAVMSAAAAVTTAGKSPPAAVRLNTAEAAIAPLSGPAFGGSGANPSAAVWGVLRVMSAEARGVVFGGVDADATAANAGGIEVVSGAQAVRCGVTHQGTLVRQMAQQEGQCPDEVALPPRRPVLITGGLGSLGQLMAGWIARGSPVAGALTLLGRSGRAKSLSLGLVHSGVVMTAARCDVSQAEDAASGTSDRSVGALLHAGGVLLDATIPNQTAGKVEAVLAPKVGRSRLTL